MKILINPGSSNCVIATIAIGKKFLNDWKDLQNHHGNLLKNTAGLIVLRKI